MSDNRQQSTPEYAREDTPSPGQVPNLSPGVQDISLHPNTGHSIVASVDSGTQSSDSRPLIQPHGFGFDGSKDCVTTITQSFKRHFVGPYPSFSDVPNDVKDIWFQDFCKSFRWNESDSALIRRNWEKVCRKRLSDHLCRNRVKYANTFPPWIDKQHWQQLLSHWNASEFKKISSANKRNRSVAGATHTGGSISFTEHENHARQEQGQNFQYKELFQRLHVFQSGPKKGEFISERSKKAVEDVTRLKEQHIHASLSSTSTLVDSPTILDDKQLFIEACGGFRKGRVYGLGSESAHVRPRSSESKFVGDSVVTPQIVELQKKLNKIEKNQKKKDEKYRHLFTYLQKIVQSAGSSLPPLPSILDDDDDDSSSHDEHPSRTPNDRDPPSPGASGAPLAV